MLRDVSACNTYNYGDALYWDARYIQEAGSFDWYQRYSSLRPFVRHYVPTSSRVLVVGCGNAVMSEDMVNDGYEEIVNVDISTVAIDMMKRKYEHVPQMKYLQMDVRDMSFFPDESFDAVIDKGTLDSLMCGTNAPICAAQMLGEVSRLLKNGGVYMLITYGDPTARMPHLNRSVFNWRIELYVIRVALSTPEYPKRHKLFSVQQTRPGFHKPGDPPPSNVKPRLEPIPLTEKGLLPANYTMEDPDSHFIYVCRKVDESVELSNKSRDPLTSNLLLESLSLGKH